MRAALAAACLAMPALSACVAAFNSALPPARYDRPHPGVRIIHAPQDRVTRLCNSLSGASRAIACAQPKADPCRVYLPSPGTYSRAREAEIERHEIAHCNGWYH